MVAEMQAAGAANDWSMTFLFEAVIPGPEGGWDE
jgi:hypothetical protein